MSEPTNEERLEAVKAHAEALAGELREAVDAGVSPALILPALMSVFREAFGEMPAGMPSLPFGLGGGS